MEGGLSLDMWLWREAFHQTGGYGGRLFTRQVAIWREAFH